MKLTAIFKNATKMLRTSSIAVLCAAALFVSACGGSGQSAAATTTSAASAAATKAASSAAASTLPEISPGKVNQLRGAKAGDKIAEFTIKDFGTVKILLFPEEAPKTVENFIGLAEKGYYDGLTFHRVIEDFMIQGGDPTGTGSGGDSFFGGEFEDEFSSDLFPIRGSLCMANHGKNTNQSQFFIVTCADKLSMTQLYQVAQAYYQQHRIVLNYDDMSQLCRENYASVGGAYWLYEVHTVFGQVIEGLNIIDAMDSVPVDANSKPLTDLVIEKITITTV